MKLGLLFSCIILYFFSCNNYQRLNYDNSAEKEITYQKVDKYKAARKRILYNAFNEYIKAADFKDEEGNVTYDSVLEFKFLFESNAKIWNDIQLYEGDPQLIDAEKYADLVFSFMNRKGVVTEFDEVSINDFFKGTEEVFDPKIDMSEADDDIFYYTYRTVKKNYNILNKNNQVLFYDEPMIYPIKITFRISIKNESAEIVKILPDN